MKRIFIIAFFGLILTACGGDREKKLPMGEKAAEGSTGERLGKQLDTSGTSPSTQKTDSIENKANY